MLAIGVDRLDYSKGLPERFRAFERFLERLSRAARPADLPADSRRSRAAKCPNTRRLRRELEGLAGHINGAPRRRRTGRRCATSTATSRTASLTGFYRSAASALVTPLRDGMNLVAKEFVAAQDPEDPGRAGAVALRGRGGARWTEALLVNPYDLDGVADAIAHAHAMPTSERKERWSALLKRLRRYDITLWRAEVPRGAGGLAARRREPVLAPGLEHHHRDRVRQVEAAIVGSHRQAQALRFRHLREHLLGQAARFRAEQEGIAFARIAACRSARVPRVLSANRRCGRDRRAAQASRRVVDLQRRRIRGSPGRRGAVAHLRA